jgi:hypothetical protein
MPFAPTQCFVVPEDVLSRVIDDEAVLLDLESGMYFGLNEVASCVWGWLQAGDSVAAMCQRIVADYEVDAERAAADLDALLDDWLTRGLVRRA